MNRREFIALICGATIASTLAASGQQLRRIGVMIALAEGDPELKKWLTAFRQRLEILGWSEGRNVQIDYRFSPAAARAAELAKELLALHPDVIVAFSTPVAAAFQRETRTIPIVFIGIADAVAQGFVHSLARPEGNLTGLTMYEASVSGKYLSMLKEIEPQLTHIAFVANPKTLRIMKSICRAPSWRRHRSGSSWYSSRSRMMPPILNRLLRRLHATCRKEAWSW
jgi:putative ABC transport system substrate-binding protein